MCCQVSPQVQILYLKLCPPHISFLHPMLYALCMPWPMLVWAYSKTLTFRDKRMTSTIQKLFYTISKVQLLREFPCREGVKMFTYSHKKHGFIFPWEKYATCLCYLAVCILVNRCSSSRGGLVGNRDAVFVMYIMGSGCTSHCVD